MCTFHTSSVCKSKQLFISFWSVLYGFAQKKELIDLLFYHFDEDYSLATC